MGCRNSIDAEKDGDSKVGEYFAQNRQHFAQNCLIGASNQVQYLWEKVRTLRKESRISWGFE